jgi:peptide/nickel transport system substrate-binding protein
MTLDNRFKLWLICLLIIPMVTVSGCAPAATPVPATATQVSEAEAPTYTPEPEAPTATPEPEEPTATSEPEGPADLRLAVLEDANVLNPYLGFNTLESTCIGFIYDTLLSYDYESGLQPALADSWKWDPGNVGATFHLNPNAMWHDGKPVTADDVVFSFEYVSGNGDVRNAFPIFFAIASAYGGVEKVDEYTVHFTFNGPQVDALRFIGSVISIIPKHIWENVEDGQSFANIENPVGSGYFRFKERTPGQYITLEHVESHYRDTSNLDTITFEIVGDASVGVLGLKDGLFDALYWEVSPDVAADVRDNPGDYEAIALSKAASTRSNTLIFNLRNAPFDDVVFRQALAKALDIEGLISVILLDLAEPLDPGLFPDALPYNNEAIAPIPYDIDMANEELDAAGYVDADGDGWRDQPDGSPITMQILCTTEQTSLDIAEYIAASFSDVNIQAEATPVDPMGFRPALKAADFDAALGNPGFGEPGMIRYYLGSDRGELDEEGQVVGFNFGGYASEAFDEIASASRMAFEQEARYDLLRQAQEVIASDLPQLPLYVPYILEIYSERRFTGWTTQDTIGVFNDETFANLQLKE